jgi:hypothetical protein
VENIAVTTNPSQSLGHQKSSAFLSDIRTQSFPTQIKPDFGLISGLHKKKNDLTVAFRETDFSSLAERRLYVVQT